MNIPKYINEKSNIIRLVSFTALFALIFINIYKPFDSSSWYKVTDFMFFVYSSLIILTGVLVVIISRIIMYFFSKNIMNPRSPHFAIFTYPDCLGMVAPEDTFLQDNVSGRVLIDRGSQKGKNKKPAQAFLQTLFDDIAAR